MNEQTMETYLIEPLAPLIVRSGRPFDGQAGTDDARFPPPSTLAGALRTAHAESCGKPLGPALAQISIAGPLPVKLDEAGKPLSLLVPKPADALYFWAADKSVRLVQTLPTALADGEGCDLRYGLLPLQLSEEIKGKPAGGPLWWALDDLLAFRAGQARSFDAIKKNGWIPPQDEIRTHVAIDRSTHAAQDGKLFQTAGLVCLPQPEGSTALGQENFPAGRIGLLGCCAGKIDNGVITLGGERRLSSISVSRLGLWPTAPALLGKEIGKARGLCLTLLTPALFASGWHPAWLQEENGELHGSPPGFAGMQLKLRAAALDRWQPHSGWDLAKARPRAGRKLVPAGAVYWFEILEASEASLAALWLIPISDHDQDRRDGFGLALPQPWCPV